MKLIPQCPREGAHYLAQLEDAQTHDGEVSSNWCPFFYQIQAFWCVAALRLHFFLVETAKMSGFL
jgi:hypothetical protein